MNDAERLAMCEGSPAACGRLVAALTEERDALRRRLAPSQGESYANEVERLRYVVETMQASVAALTERAEKAEARAAEYEHRINWNTTCGRCADRLDACYALTVRAERAEAQVAAVRALAEQWADETRTRPPWEQWERDVMGTPEDPDEYATWQDGYHAGVARGAVAIRAVLESTKETE